VNVHHHRRGIVRCPHVLAQGIGHLALQLEIDGEEHALARLGRPRVQHVQLAAAGVDLGEFFARLAAEDVLVVRFYACFAHLIVQDVAPRPQRRVLVL